MRRKQTRITVWPAIADLMTAILVIAFLTGMVTLAYTYSPNESEGPIPPPPDQDTVTTLTQERDSLISQVDSLLIANSYLDSLLEVIDRSRQDEGKIGNRSCLGEERENVPKSLLTIRVMPSGYYIIANKIEPNHQMVRQSDQWRELNEQIGRYDRKELSKSQMTDFAKVILRLGEEWPSGDCRFSPTIQDGGVSPDSLFDAWYKFLGRYFGPLTNPGIIPKVD